MLTNESQREQKKNSRGYIDQYSRQLLQFCKVQATSYAMTESLRKPLLNFIIGSVKLRKFFKQNVNVFLDTEFVGPGLYFSNQML